MGSGYMYHLLQRPHGPPLAFAPRRHTAMASDQRSAVLDRYFRLFARGKLPTLTRENSRHVLDAICTKEAPVVLQALIAEPLTLDALWRALVVKTDPIRLNGRIARVIVHLQDPALSAIGSGASVAKVVAQMARPPTLLLAYREALLAGELTSIAGQKAFSWLLLRCSSLPPDLKNGLDSLMTSCLDVLLASPHSVVQTTAQALQRALSGVPQTDDGPGGRHDNDHADFQSIAILPTADELGCEIPPYLLSPLDLDDLPTSSRAQAHVENQFRLLREDMLYALREEIEQLNTKRGLRGLAFDGLQLIGVFAIHYDDRGHQRSHRWCLQLQCTDELSCLRDVDVDDREEHLRDERQILRHQSSTCLIVDGTPIAFPTIHRDVERLARDPAVICLQFDGKVAVMQALIALKTGKSIQLVQLETAIFAYEPVLKSLQGMRLPALAPELFLWDDESVLEPPPVTPDNVIKSLRDDPLQDIGAILNLGRVIVLDPAQRTALLSALSQRVALIQGPPGCGKSFVGALIAKILYDTTRQTILVSCFTNHALDQFLEDLLDNGIPESSMVRLGGKSTPRTAPLSLYSQARTRRFDRSDWQEIDLMQAQARERFSDLEARYAAFQAGVTDADLLEYLKGTRSLTAFSDAFTVKLNVADDGMVMVGANGRDVSTSYLLARWKAGKDAGVLGHRIQSSFEANVRVWGMSHGERRKELRAWREALLSDKASKLFRSGERYNAVQASVERKFSEGSRDVLLGKRIIACTTTGAAKYAQWLQEVSPEVLLVEEAGEILESHVLTALGARTRHMILIGDHQQLRPKVNNYPLTVESGGGYELNVSLFERLANPDLLDAPSTSGRPDLLGVRDNVVFITHDTPEDDSDEDAKANQGLRSSKRNTFEAEMVLKTVRYLLQQGYDTSDLVVLTPYLGQLQKLRQMMLQADHNPFVGDLDSGELLRAGLTGTDAGVGQIRKSIRLATIDNYQGEESNIVIVSLVRSNSSHDIGFMSSPERLNVLLSRARNALIMIGNPDTFKKSRSGKTLYSRFFSFLKEDGHFYDGLPTRCTRHPDQSADLSAPAHFGQHAPEGGCLKPCDELLSCGLHACPHKCHLDDHSQIKCQRAMSDRCQDGHRRTWSCYQGVPAICETCEQAAARVLKRREQRESEEREFKCRVAELETEIEKLRVDQEEV
ncbi:hypothetical protein PENSPDRAFT_732801 [Peniophora sp. CONT]|nr:hypothetical protein PENSPDRAFT_732801 [Peniophora sp. CONT]